MLVVMADYGICFDDKKILEVGDAGIEGVSECVELLLGLSEFLREGWGCSQEQFEPLDLELRVADVGSLARA